LCTTGLDDRLAWMLGVPRLSDQPIEACPQLSIQRLVPRVLVREYGALILKSEALSRRLFGNRFVTPSLEAVPGFEDFAILGKAWHEATRAGAFDVVVFDGPASGHLRLALGVPATIVESAPDGPLRREATAMLASLRDPTITAAILVSLAERWPLTESNELAATLARDLGIGLAALVVNKLWPHRVAAIPPAAEPRLPIDAVLDVLAEMGARARARRAVVTDWLRDADKELVAPVAVGLPWFPERFDGPDALERLLGQATALRTQDAA
jgi:anion-transporting  ArsA/GET3 family ATPase